MKIYLLDINANMTNTWEEYFASEKDVFIVNEDFKDFMDRESDNIDCVVSPANSYGFMDGGYDLAISKWFGFSLMDKVQDYILKTYYGEQPIGSSFIIDTDVNNIKLIHTPTMRVPGPIKEPLLVYQCMRTTLMTAIENNVQGIVIPAFGGFYGELEPKTVCKMMWEGYKQIMNPPKKLTFNYAWRSNLED